MIKPYSDTLYDAVEWWMEFYFRECFLNDPLTNEELHDVLHRLLETISIAYNRPHHLVKDDLIAKIESDFSFIE